MVRKILLTLIALLGGGILLSQAQSKQISGTVTGSDGKPIAGVTVVVEGTSVGTTTNAAGAYSISAGKDAKLVFSFIGMENQTVPVSGKSVINVQMKENAIGVDEVVVTAMGITRSEKSLGYSVSTVKADEINKAREGNVLNALAGKVAGVNISAASGTAGGGSRIIIRGQSSLGSAGSPLFVIDGMPVSNQSYNPTGINGSVDVGNRMGDISGDDIESINVLKGAAATALYGARAKDGAIIITTKKGSRMQKTSVTINSTLRFENILKAPNFQNSYAGGNSSDGTYNPYSQNGWGPKIEGQTVQNFLGDEVQLKAYKNNVKDFYNTGHTYINNISVAGGDEKNDFRLGFTAHNQKGIIPKNDYDKYNVAFNGGRKFNDKLEARVSFNYAHTSSAGRPAQGSNEINVLVPQINGIARNWDLNWLKDNWMNEDGTQGKITEKSTSGNFYWTVNKNLFTNTVDRLYGTATVTYKPIEGLTITNNLGTDYFHEERRQIWASGTIGRPKGQFNTNDITNRQINNDLMISYDAKFNEDWGLKVMLGHNINQNMTKYLEVSAKDLLVADVYTYANAESVVSTNDMVKSRLIGLYGEVDLSYKDIVYLSVTGRNDWSSTMPKSHRSYFYPSVSAGFVFSELIPKNDVLSFGKFRVSYANVGSDTAPYQLDFLYYPVSEVFGQFGCTNYFPFGGLLGYEATPTYPDPNLEPQNQSSFEVGADLRFFNGRLRLDATYYYQKTTKNIVRLDVANSTGFFYMRKNAGVITNEGVEILLGATPVQTRNFRWDIDVNFASNKQLVKELDPSVKAYTLASGYEGTQIKAVEGESFSLYGSYWLRDENGNFAISENGTRIKSSDTKNLGKVSPDWTMGIGNTFSYKGLSLSFLLDIRYGGVMYSGTVQQLRTSGLAEETLGNDRAEIIDKGFVYKDGQNTGEKNTKAITPYQFWNTNYDKSITEANVFDATFIKLREIVLAYQMPKKWFEHCFIGSLSVGFEARNLWLIKSNVPHIDPEASIFGPSSVGSGIEYAGIPSTRSYGFNIKLTF